jgi:hypothetical protein
LIFVKIGPTKFFYDYFLRKLNFLFFKKSKNKKSSDKLFWRIKPIDKYILDL